MKYLVPFLFLVLIGGGCTPQEQSENAYSAVTHIAFAADFANGNGCTSAGNAAGCDIYTADVTKSGDVQNVTRLTSDDAGESAPAWHPTGSILYFTSQIIGANTHIPAAIHYIHIDTHTSGTLIERASHPTVLPSGDALIYSALPKHVLTQSTLSTSGDSILRSHILIDGGDRFEPTISGDGKMLVFHETSAENPGASIYNIATKEMTNIANVEGTGHCGINRNGTFAVCDQKSGGGLAGTKIVNGVPGKTSLAVADPKIPVISALDADYADCDLASVNFPSFFDDTTLLVTISCHQRSAEGLSDAIFSKLFLANIETNTFIPLGKNLKNAYGGNGRDSYTAAARAIPTSSTSSP